MPEKQGTGVASFRSRQQVQRFEQILHLAGIESRVIHTPHEIAIGCGLSVAFEPKDYPAVRKLYEQSTGLTSFVGFYHCMGEGTRLRCTAWGKHLG